MSPAAHTPSAAPVTQSSIYRVRVSLLASEPEIWRLIEVRSGLHLDEFHTVLQFAMGWQNSHLHLFTNRSPFEHGTTPPRMWLDADSIEDGMDGELETAVTLGEVLTSASGPLYYEYDFGDSWVHLIELIEVIAQDAGTPLATVIRGERRCPLEDSGGTPGYAEKLAILADPSHEDFAFITDWVGGSIDPWSPTGGAPFDPATFDIAAANSLLDEWASQRSAAEKPPASDEPRAAASVGSELDALVQRMHPDAQSPFRSYVRRAGADRAAHIEPVDAAAMVEPYAWLIRRVGLEGMQLSAAGWMQPAVVTDAMRELGWQDRWYGKFNREDQTMPIARLRASAQQLGLLRKLKGRLLLSVAARKLLDDPVALWRFLARALALKQPDEASRDATLLLAVELAAGERPKQDDIYEAVAYGMGALGWRFDARSSPEESVGELTRDSWRTLTDLGVLIPQKFPSTAAPVTPEGREFVFAMLNG